jgi:hypothetical protein
MAHTYLFNRIHYLKKKKNTEHLYILMLFVKKKSIEYFYTLMPDSF